MASNVDIEKRRVELGRLGQRKRVRNVAWPPQQPGAPTLRPSGRSSPELAPRFPKQQWIRSFLRLQADAVQLHQIREEDFTCRLCRLGSSFLVSHSLKFVGHSCP